MMALIRRYNRRGSLHGISDICDGRVYQELVADVFLSKEDNVSLQFNTDGIPVFKSSSYSF